MSKRKGASMTEIIRFIREQFERELAAGRSLAEAGSSAELATRQTFAGERPYIAGYPKQRRAVQIAQLNLKTSRELSVASGLPLRTVQRLRSGR